MKFFDLMKKIWSIVFQPHKSATQQKPNSINAADYKKLNSTRKLFQKAYIIFAKQAQVIDAVQ